MFTITEKTITTPTGALTYMLHTPSAPQRAANPALLLTFSSTRQASFGEPPYDIPARIFAEAGHYVVNFDLPNHGEQINAFGQGIVGMAAAFNAGQDPFEQFIRQGRTVLDVCLDHGIGAGGVLACGVSRAGYCALRLTADDPRIQGVAGLAPVTDWRRLTEFAAMRQQPTVAALALDHYVDALAQRAVFLAIGNHDERVGTDACVRFALQLFTLERTQGSDASRLQLHVVPDAGHSLADEWRAAGAKFLLP